MMTYLIVFIILTVLSYAYYRIADHFNIVDKPNHRSSHTITTIRGGGILFYIAIVIYFIYSGCDYSFLFAGVSLIALVSFIDDLKPLPPYVRLPVQFISIALVLFQLELGFVWYGLLLVLICGVGFMNFYNFMDGINGLTAVYSLVLAGFFLIMNEMVIEFIDRDLLVFLLFSIVIFAFYNFRKKALMFSGDVGSISMAVILFFLFYKLYLATGAVAIIITIGVYGIDTSLTILKKIKLRESLSEAHRHHVYQLLVDHGNLSHLAVAVIYGAFQSLLCFIFYWVYEYRFGFQMVVVFGVFIVMTAMYLVINSKLAPKKQVSVNE